MANTGAPIDDHGFTLRTLGGLTDYNSTLELCEFVSRAAQPSLAATPWDLLKRFAIRFGMTELSVVDFMLLSETLAPALVYSDAPAGLIRTIDREGLAPTHPVLMRARTDANVFAISELASASGGERWRELLSPAIQFGDGLVVPIVKGRSTGVAVFSGYAPDLRPIARAMLHVAAPFAFVRAQRLGSEAHPERTRLSKRERACLDFAAQGHNDFRVGRMLGISGRTVRFHIQNAKNKLGVSSRIEAVAIAINERDRVAGDHGDASTVSERGTSSAQGAVVCVMDDDKVLLDLMCGALRTAGFSVAGAPDGRAGMKIVEQARVSVVVVDIVMPDHREGIETIAELKARFPDVRILAISGAGAMGPGDYLEIALNFGADDCLAKPFQYPELVAKVVKLAEAAADII